MTSLSDRCVSKCPRGPAGIVDGQVSIEGDLMAITRGDTLLTPELIEEYTAAGYWSEETLADAFRRNADQFPNKVAYVDDHTQETWGEVWQISGEVASGLARRGVGRGGGRAGRRPGRGGGGGGRAAGGRGGAGGG